ncbi:Prophage MuSo2 [uncultured Pleomorphomonas sp.]|uniref:Phage morphogenesis protein n=2 Tax=Pleomorphomonas TaxID=261933 RepID=A0A2G9WV46_9HYPH|nr:phage virion morphogenesis protein [Pleomorphomonas carboxyditropha]PIO98585.1 phage morphogenesis protein [Pleomorphomonas carboxyditropha]SCM75438.1 Prophage MuSo2 [uncultured Pleomorphomonas sp.]
MSSSIVVDINDLELTADKIAALEHVDPSDLMTNVGAIGESQTRRRITEEKTGPDGTPWPPNRTGTSILLRTGEHLLGSVAFVASADEAEWGASWEWAHVHQDGMTIKPKDAKRLAFVIGNQQIFARQVTIPPRPFVGLSDDNRVELSDVTTDWLGSLLQ